MVNFDNFGGLTYVLKFHIFPIFNCEELVRIRAICEGLVRFFSDVKNRYSIFTNVKNWYQFFPHVKNWYSIFTNVKNQYQMLTDVKNRGVSHYRILPASRDIGWPVQQLDYFRYTKQVDLTL